MEIVPYKIVAFDAASHCVFIADGPSGEISAEFSLPKDLSPIDLTVYPGSQAILISLAGADDTGALRLLDLGTQILNRFSPVIPKPEQIACVPGSNRICLADQNGTIHIYDPADSSLICWKKPPDSLRCAGLAGCCAYVYGVWETAGGGLLATFDQTGEIISQYPLGGRPTGLTLDSNGRLFVPFTTGLFAGEGVYILDPKNHKQSVVTLQCSCCPAAVRAYPLHAAVDKAGDFAYIACEDNASVAIIDVNSGSLCGSIALGHSVSRLALLPGDKFAIASSNMFADLCLIDLVNKRPLSFTSTKRELLSPLAVIN